MTNANDKVQEIFQEAIEFDSIEARNVFLVNACSESSHLRSQVDRLLCSHDKASKFLELGPTMSFEEPARLADSDATQLPSSARGHHFQIDEQLPCFFGDYELLEKIAHGGMGVVFKARQASLNRTVAIKMILSGQFAGQDEIQRFYIEAKAAGILDHAGIVPVFDVGNHRGQHYFSMAYVEGKSLSARIKEGTLRPREAATLTKKIAIAIQFAHDQGVVHRDLKPGNVLLDNRNEPRVADFGLAKRVEGDSKLTTTGMVLGTPSYMPPEQAEGKETGAAGDVYSLGAILYAMLTGRPPFDGETQLETILQVLQDEPIAPRKIDNKIPKDLEAICLKCLEKKSSDRYSTANDLTADLQRFLENLPIHAKNDFKRRFRKWWIREPALAAHLMVSVILLAMLWLNYCILNRDDVIGTNHDWSTFLGNCAILLGSAVILFLFQKTQNKFQTKSVIPFAWAATNPVFLTIALSWNAEQGRRQPDPTNYTEDIESLSFMLSIYLMLMVSSCFFRRVELVAITTITSLIGFGILVPLYFPNSAHDTPSAIVVFAVNMVVTGCLLGLLTMRMNRQTEQNAL